MPQPQMSDLPAGHEVLWDGHLGEVVETYEYNGSEWAIVEFANGSDGHVNLTDERLDWNFPDGDASAWV